MIGAPRRKSIHLFDLDDTLMTSAARVLVVGADGAVRASLSTADFPAYRLSEGESFDFREFSDVGILGRGIVVKYTRAIIEAILRHGTRSHFGVLTARANQRAHARFLSRLFHSLFGVRLSRSLIFAVNDQAFAAFHDRAGEYSRLPVAEKKAWVIERHLIARGYNDISFYDDTRANLESFRNLATRHPGVAFKPHFIDPAWAARLEEFCRAPAERKLLARGRASARIILENHTGFPHLCDALVEEAARGRPVRLSSFPVHVVAEGGRFYLVKSPPGRTTI